MVKLQSTIKAQLEKDGMHWKKGDECLARWSEDGDDGEYYKCQVVEVFNGRFGDREARIKYIGYDEEEIVSAINLKKRSTPTQRQRKSHSEHQTSRVQNSTCQLRIQTQSAPSALPCPFSRKDTSSWSFGRYEDKDMNAITRDMVAVSPRYGKYDGDISKLKVERDECMRYNKSPTSMELDEGTKPRFSWIPPSPNVAFPLGKIKDKLVEIPSNLNQYLHEFQREGVKFLFSHYVANQGAILGDDMGLGKTIQAIAFLVAIQYKTGVHEHDMMPNSVKQSKGLPLERKPALVSVPSSIARQFREEIDLWGYFKVEHVLKGEDVANIVKSANDNKLDVVVCSHDLVSSNAEKLNEVEWDVVIVDEVHKLTKTGSIRRKGFNQLKCKRRFGLTGTPIQNELLDIFNLSEWIFSEGTNPLGDKQEFLILERLIKEGMSVISTEDETKRKDEIQAWLREKISSFYLSRQKKDFPNIFANVKKHERVVFCAMPDDQQAIYDRVLDNKIIQAMIRQSQLCKCFSGKKTSQCCEPIRLEERKFFSWTHMIRSLLTHPAMACTNPPSANSDNPPISQHDRDMIIFGCPQDELFDRVAAARELNSAKMMALKVMLPVWKKDGAKVLLFSESIVLLDIIEDMIMDQYGFCRYEGKYSAKIRHQMIRSFNDDPDKMIFLISKLAGGTGLNLVAANIVVLMDPSWNPTTDAQAVDRAYRLGQKKDVYVYKLITKDSLDEIVLARQGYKIEQAGVALGGEGAKKGAGQYEAVRGDDSRRGELFGIGNMLDHKRLRDLNKRILEKAVRVDRAVWEEAGVIVYEAPEVQGDFNVGDDERTSTNAHHKKRYQCGGESGIESGSGDDSAVENEKEVNMFNDGGDDGFVYDSNIDVDYWTGKVTTNKQTSTRILDAMKTSKTVGYTATRKRRSARGGMESGMPLGEHINEMENERNVSVDVSESSAPNLDHGTKKIRTYENKQTGALEIRLPMSGRRIRYGGQPVAMAKDIVKTLAEESGKKLMEFLFMVENMDVEQVQSLVDKHYEGSFDECLKRDIVDDKKVGEN
eukprot:CFRG4705T1